MQQLGTYAALQQTELFSFFNIRETGRANSGEHMQTISCKPGGFQESIDLAFNVARDDSLRGASLLLDRSWIGNGEHVNPFANDITKSFIDGLVPESDQPAVKHLVAAIMDAKGHNDKRINLHPPEQKGAPSINTIKAMATYLGAIPLHVIDLASSKVKLENVTLDNRARLRIEIEPKHGKA
jgi:hypothetical protein